MTTTRVRIAAGACMLSTCLLVGSAGVAAADPDSTGSSGSGGQNQGSSATKSATTAGPGRFGSSPGLSDSLRRSVRSAIQKAGEKAGERAGEKDSDKTADTARSGTDEDSDPTVGADTETAAATDADTSPDTSADTDADSGSASDEDSDATGAANSDAAGQASGTEEATGAGGPADGEDSGTATGTGTDAAADPGTAGASDEASGDELDGATGAAADPAGEGSEESGSVPAGETTEAVTHRPAWLDWARPEPAAGHAGHSGTSGGIAPVSDAAGATDPQTAATGPTIPGSDADTAATLIDPLEKFTGAVVSLGNAVASIPPLLLSLPGSETPITDFITGMEYVLTSVSDSVVQLTQVPADVFYVLGGGALVIGDVSPAPVAANAATPAHLPPALTPVPATDTMSTAGPEWTAPPMATTDDAATFAAGGGLAAYGLSQSAPRLQAPLIPAADSASGSMMRVVKRVVDDLLLPVSLWTLATAALPGLGGLLIISAAGVRIGYRQAKAGLALRTSGLARFAGPGPLGVVRSDSLVVLGPRVTRRRTRPEAERLVDRVA